MALDILTISLLGVVAMIIPLLMLYFKPTKKVELLRPRDRRGQTLSVSRETDLALECKKSKGVIYRFIKAGPSWVFNQSGKMVTKFFGMEGTAYTGMMKGNAMVNVPVKEYLEFLWGDKFYNAIPDDQKRKVETDVWGITVEIGKIKEEDYDLTTLTAADIDDEGDTSVLRRIAKAAEPSKKGQFYQFLVGTLLGGSLVFFLMTQGYI